jgi:hypothetical protein
VKFIPSSKGRGQDYWQDENIIEEMPCCRQMFNIFHPYDPVAYRFVAFLHIPSSYVMLVVSRNIQFTIELNLGNLIWCGNMDTQADSF